MDIALVNASQRFDGHTLAFHNFVAGLASQGLSPKLYTCVDPSSAPQYEPQGEQLMGSRFPGGGRAEMAWNRWRPVFARQVARLPGDVLHVHDAYLARTAEYRDNVVATLMDLGKLTTRHYPRTASWVHNRNLRWAPRCRGIVCCSEFVRREILRSLRVPDPRVRVVPLYGSLPPLPEPREPPPEPTVASPWTLLYIATDRPHKNLETFFQVLRGLDARFRGRLVSALTPRTRRRIQELGLERRVQVESGLPDLRAVYRSSQVLVFPSVFEGFGLPVVEAMGQGLPVLASDRTSLPEVVGSGGSLLDPEDLPAWTRAIIALTDPKSYREAAHRAWERSRSFTAERTGLALVSAYREFLALGPGRSG